MKQLFFLISLLIIISCKQQSEETIQQNFDFDAWIEENRIPQHEKLISVEGYESDADECKTDEENEVITVSVQVNKDTIIASFCLFDVSYLGRLIFDISIENDTVKLLKNGVHNPYQTTFIDGEVSSITYTYTILNDSGQFDNKNWIVGYRNLMKE